MDFSAPPQMPKSQLVDVELVADGLLFPEGPVALSDGSVLLVEMERGTVTHVVPDKGVVVVADCGGMPNGLAIGPDGGVYICNNGGRWPKWNGGRIERLDLATGAVDVLYTECDGRQLLGPNDLVFDRLGNMWFTDVGKIREFGRDDGSILYASPGGDSIVRVFPKLDTPNGIGLSPDGSTLYWAESIPGRLYRRAITGPGSVSHTADNDAATVLCVLPVGQHFDSLAVDGKGNVCVGTLMPGCITVVAPDGSSVHQLCLPTEFEDDMVTNICFAGDHLSMAYLTLTKTGRLVRCPWPTPGLELAFNA